MSLPVGSVVRVCQECSIEFTTFSAWIRVSGGKFCSLQCSQKGRTKRPVTIMSSICQECGEKYSFRKGGRVSGTKYCTRSCQVKARARLFSGPNSPRWKGGTSKRTSAAHSVARCRVKEIGRCEKCGSIDNLQGHHKQSHSKFPELREDPNNIEVLCSQCHALEHPSLAHMIAIPRKKGGSVKSCAVCGNEFYAIPSRVERQHCCGPSCAGIYIARNRIFPRSGQDIKCEQCGAIVYVMPSQTSKKYCSRPCQLKSLHAKTRLR